MPEDKKEKPVLTVEELGKAWDVTVQLRKDDAIDDKKKQRMGRKIVARLNRMI